MANHSLPSESDGSIEHAALAVRHTIGFQAQVVLVPIFAGATRTCLAILLQGGLQIQECLEQAALGGGEFLCAQVRPVGDRSFHAGCECGLFPPAL